MRGVSDGPKRSARNAGQSRCVRGVAGGRGIALAAGVLSWVGFVESGFFSWFAVEEVGRQQGRRGDTLVTFKVGSYREAVDLEVALDPKGRVTAANLLLDRAWIGDRFDISPFAVDIARSFLRALAGPFPDAGALGTALWRLLDGEPASAAWEDFQGAVDAFVGSTSRSTVRSPGSTLVLENVVASGRARLRIALCLACPGRAGAVTAND